MINKVFNWTAGSFFRTLGRFLFYIVIGILAYFCISGFPQVHAETVEWGKNIKYQFNDHRLYDWNSSTSYVEVPHMEGSPNWFHDQWGYDVVVLTTPKQMTVASNGISFNFLSNIRMSNDYIYAVSLYVCSSVSQAGWSATASVGPNTINVLTNVPTYTVTNQSDLSLQPYSYTDLSYVKSCNYYTSIVQPSVQGSWISYRFKSTTSRTGWVMFLGYDLEVLGSSNNLSSSDIDNAIKNSGLATASSVAQVQSSINNLSTDINKLNDTQKETNKKLDEMNDNLTNSNTNGAQDKANSFFKDFDDNDYGLSDIITTPLQLINNLSTASCSPLEIPIPFVNTNVTLPCMYDIYQQYFGSILTIYQTITTGLIAYWISINIFATVKGFKDPESDNVEVMEL